MRKCRFHLVVLIIFLVGSVAACGSAAENSDTAEPTEEETPTTAVMEETSTPTVEPATPTPAATEEKTPESPQLSPEVEAELEKEEVEFETIEELLVYNDSLTEVNKQLVIDEINNQFKEGLDSNKNCYYFICVTTGWEYHDPSISLPNGLQISHTASCQLLDADGNPQIIQIPMMVYNSEEGNESYVIADGGVISVEIAPDGYDMGEVINLLTTRESGPLNILERKGYLEKGFVLLIKVSMPGNQEDLNHWQEDYYEEVIKNFYTQELLDEFAQTGNPDLLGNDSLLIPVDTSLSHIYSTYSPGGSK